MSTVVSQKYSIRTFFFHLFLLVIVTMIILGLLKVVVVKAKQRSYINSISSTIVRNNIKIGIDDYGYISNLNVRVGDMVNKGDIIFKYTKSSGEGVQPDQTNEYFSNVSEIAYRARSSGIVKNLYVNSGSYITKNDTILELQENKSRVRSRFKIPAENIGQITVGSETRTYLPNGTIATGYVESIFPFYETDTSSIQVESLLDTNETNLLEGLPVQTELYIGDSLSTDIEKGVGQIVALVPFKPFQEFYSIK